jgi:hypothetical protein
MSTDELLAAAERLLAERDERLARTWPRAVALLTRQALERTIQRQLSALAPSTLEATASVQLIALRQLSSNSKLAREVAWAWDSLSAACHSHGYELHPHEEHLRRWIAVARRFAESSTKN